MEQARLPTAHCGRHESPIETLGRSAIALGTDRVESVEPVQDVVVVVVGLQERADLQTGERASPATAPVIVHRIGGRPPSRRLLP